MRRSFFALMALAVAAIGLADRPAAQPPTPTWAGERYAVVIGVGIYDAPTIPRLRFAENDARALHRFLTTRGGFKPANVLLLTDTSPQKPTLAEIKHALGEWLHMRAGKDDLVLVYYAGHGAPELDATGNDRPGLSKYLIAKDTNPMSLFVTAFAMDDIEIVFRRIVAERVVFLIDANFSGSASRRSGRSELTHVEFLERMARARGRVVISAAGPNELALELPELKHGLFTWYLLKGLEGAADSDGDGIVAVAELYLYLQKNVSAHARRERGRQVPVMSGAIGDLPLVQVTRPVSP